MYRLKQKVYTVKITDWERRAIANALYEYKNLLRRDGRSVDAYDEIMVKLVDAPGRDAPGEQEKER